MKLNLKNTLSVRLQLFFMLSFILLTVLLMLQKHSNETKLTTNSLISDKAVFCVSEICLDQQCIEVPGNPRLAKLIIINNFDNNEVKHIKVKLYNKYCGTNREN